MKQATSQSEARQRIIDTALDLFYRQGYLATGINQVIAEAGVSKNTFYYYFTSKEDLCVVYLQERHKLWMGWLMENIERYEAPYDRLMSVFEFIESWLNKCNFRGCAFLNIASEVPDINHRLRKEVVDHKNGLRTVLRRLLVDIQKSDKKFSGMDVSFMSDALYVLFEGVISACQNYGDTKIVDAARKNFLKLLKAV